MVLLAGYLFCGISSVSSLFSGLCLFAWVFGFDCVSLFLLGICVWWYVLLFLVVFVF